MSDKITSNIPNEATKEPISGTWSGTDTVFMSNNINPFTVMPLAPNQVGGGQLTANISVDTISSYTPGRTIEVLSSMNVNPPNTFKYDGQSLYPFTIYSPEGFSSALCSETTGNEGEFTVTINSDEQLQMTDGKAFFRYGVDNEYNMTIDGFLTTSNSVGIGQPADPAHALSVSGDVLITGRVDLAGVQLANLGIGTSIPSGSGLVFDVSGNSLLDGITTITKNTYIQGYLGIGKTSATVPLDVSGNAAISNNMTVTGTTFTNRLGIGKLTNWTTPFVMDILGNTRMTGSLAVSNNLDVSRNLTVIGSTTITGVGVALNSPALSVTGNIACSSNLTGQTANFTGNVKVEGKLGIGIGGATPQEALDMVGDIALTGGISAGGNIEGNRLYANIILLQGANQLLQLTDGIVNTPNIYIGNNISTHIQDPAYVLQLEGAAQFGTSTSPGQIAINKDVAAYTFDMSGTLNTTQAITSNLYVQNIYGAARVPDPSCVNMYGVLNNNTSINTPRINILTDIPVSELNVTGTSDFFGNTNTIGTVTVTGNIIQNPGSYLKAPTPITLIRYAPGASSSNINFGEPGYWSIPLVGSAVTLYLNTWPVFYIIDGSGSNTDMTVTIQSDGGPNRLRTGLNFHFIGRHTTVGHSIVYPYSSGSTYTKTLTNPLSFSLLCIGTDDYSST